MSYTKTQIKQGVELHQINTNKFKTNIISVFLTTKLSKEDITKKALILATLRRGTKTLSTQEQINTKLEELYGAEFDCGINKMGDNHIFKFYIESLNDKFLYKKESILDESASLLFDVVFNPLTENDGFKSEYVENEKQNLKRIIEAKKDNKRTYSTDRCVEEMYKDQPYGLYKYGYVEDLEKITSQELYSQYKEIIKDAKIDIFASGDFEQVDIKGLISSNLEKYNIDSRSPDYIKENVGNSNLQKENIVKENMDVSQGNLVIGIDILNTTIEDRVAASVYNTILGGGANSKLFQNVREKASLAYSAGSIYIKTKSNIIIKSGIEHKNYDKAVQIIKEQLEDMKKGKFEQKDIDDAKILLISSYMSMQDEQDSEISYYFNKELENEYADVQAKIEEIKKVTKEQIIDIANKVQINTIYFLTKIE